ncbi:MAG: hypothetical protein V1660_01245 [archaeon]
MGESDQEIKLEGKDVLNIVGEINKRYKTPLWENRLVYDSSSETLEPIYFWILDAMERFGNKVEKLIDNFTATPGSGYFAELGARATKMQDEAMKILGSVNTVVKSIINIIYDLKEYEIRLKQYEIAHSKNKDEKEAGILGLKQVWMDQVDIKRGRGSINFLTSDMSFTTLRDAFMKVNTIEEVDQIDLNDRVKRILKPRVAEFFEWKKRSESELTKRFEIERTYLKSQVSALQLYSRWAKPYLKAAEDLRMKQMQSPHLVSSFNTIMLEVLLLGIKKISLQDMAYNKEVPLKYVNYKPKREYYACVLVDFNFRGIPRRITQEGHYGFGGKTIVDFSAFTLNEDELALFRNKLEKSDISTALNLVEDVTQDSLDQLKEDIDNYLNKKEEKEEKEEKEDEDEEFNPFSALFSFGSEKKEEKKEKKKNIIEEIKKKGITPDSYDEAYVRNIAEMQAAEGSFMLFNLYKKVHGMAAPQLDIDFWELFHSKGKKGF